MRLFKLLSGVILIFSGIFCFANPGVTFLSIAFVLGCTMLISGGSGVLAYIWIRRKNDINDLLLAEGVMNLILGSLVVSNQLQADAAIPVFFGLWVIYSGVMSAVEGLPDKTREKPFLRWLVVLGSVSVMIGLYAFFNTVFFHYSTVKLVGILFMMQGVDVLLVGANLSFHQHRRKNKKR